MAKGKLSKRDTTVPNKALHSRISFLYQAAVHFASLNQSEPNTVMRKDQNIVESPRHERKSNMPTAIYPLSRRWVSDLRHISLKAQIRMAPALKHTMCKSCNTILIDGSTCTIKLENKSKNGSKPWADVLIKECTVCATVARFPVSAPRQKRRPLRSSELTPPQARRDSLAPCNEPNGTHPPKNET
ncbi:hypothetical protein K3495_g11328 [Podosphaera aphanis]|nr:hypothetical protein K3495_g11328 [Podosphaera aphanis]